MDIDFKILKEYPSLASVKEDGYCNTVIGNYIKMSKIYDGFIWIYKPT